MEARTRRDHLVDAGMVLFAFVSGVVPTVLSIESPLPGWALNLDYAVGVLGCLALWWRRRYSLEIGVVLTVLSLLSLSVSAAAFVALFTVAVRRNPTSAVALAGSNVLAFFIYLETYGSPLVAPQWLLLALQGMFVTVLLVWGLLIRSRRQLIASLRERAAAAEVEAQLRAERIQLEAREALAREMHDVLGHRLSLLSVSAGALTYGRGASPEDVAKAAEMVRDNAHRALQDLREVIGVLRAPERDIPLPGIHDVVELVEEGEQAGSPVDLQDVPGVTTGDRDVPETAGRTAYRLVQEGLTNARKHAPGAPVVVRITGGPGEHLDVEVVNGPPAGAVDPPVGSGEGLRGLAERAALVGGRLDHGRTADGGWRLSLRLPWPP